MFSVGANPGPSCRLTHLGPMLLVFFCVAVLHMEEAGKTTVYMHPQ